MGWDVERKPQVGSPSEHDVQTAPMAVRFWASPHLVEPPQPGRVTLAPRRMNLTELKSFADLMAQMAGSNASWTLANHAAGTPPVGLESLQNTVPVDRALLTIRARPLGDELPHWLDLTLGTPHDPAVLHAHGGGPRLQGSLDYLAARWADLGTPRRTGAVIYPIALAAIVVAVVGAPVAGWIRGELSLWLIPVVLGVAAMLLATGAPYVRKRMAEARAHRSGLSLRFGTMQKVAEDRATRMWALIAALSGSVLTALVAITIAVLKD